MVVFSGGWISESSRSPLEGVEVSQIIEAESWLQRVDVDSYGFMKLPSYSSMTPALVLCALHREERHVSSSALWSPLGSVTSCIGGDVCVSCADRRGRKTKWNNLLCSCRLIDVCALALISLPLSRKRNYTDI